MKFSQFSPILARLVPVLALSFTIRVASGQEWTRFRGPNGSGLSAAEEAIPTELGPKSIRWKLELPGVGSSSPVLWGSKLFLTAEAGKEGQRQVMCIDSTSGKQLWTVVEPFKKYAHHQFNNFASSTPVCDEKHLYIAWTSGEEMQVIALTHAGKQVWQANLGYYKEEHGSGASPILVGQTLLVSKDHEGKEACLSGLDTATGKVKWSVPRNSSRTAFSTPIVMPHPDKIGQFQVIYSSNPDALTALEPETGKILWQQNYTKASKFRAVGSPAEVDDIILSSVGQGGGAQDFVAVKLKDGKPETAWEGVKGLPYVPTPIGKDGHFYVLNDGGNISCLKAATGEVVYKERLFNNAYSSPVVAGERMLCIGRGGELAVVKLGEKFEKLAEGNLDEPCDSTPAIANGMVFIRTTKHLIAMGGAKAKKGAGVSLEIGTDASPITAGKPFHAALKLVHEPGYHTYWKNPGIAGIPMTLEWQLPAGWTASETLWAPPEKVKMGQLSTHGYDKDTVLVWEITPAANIEPGRQFQLPARLQWMCCATRCNPGTAQLVLPLTVGENSEPTSWAGEIKTALEKQPPSLTEWSFKAKRQGQEVILNATPKSPQAVIPANFEKTQFFGETNLICSNELQSWQIQDQGFTAKLPVASYASASALQPARLIGLLFNSAGWNRQKALTFAHIDVAIE